jgi:PKD repeat protein
LLILRIKLVLQIILGDILLDRKLIVFFLISFLILVHIPVALCITSAPIVYVAGDNSGDFNCNGTNDQIEINQALQFVADNPQYTTVYLKGPFTYTINDTILIGNCTVLTGDSSATIKLADNANWIAYKPLIKENNFGNYNITIQGFTINGNREGNNNVISGQGYYNLIYLSNCQNINVHDMHLTDNHGDGLKINNCCNIKFYNNNAYLLGHDVLYAITSSNLEAYKNKISCRTNSGLRIYNTNHVDFHDNVITSEGSGGAGIEIQKYGSPAMDDIDVYNNVIYKTALPGIWVFGSASYTTSSANVHIHHNQIYDTGTTPSSKIIGGILSDGFNALIEDNVIDGAYGSGIVQNNVYSPGPTGSGYVVTIKNNIITNTRVSVTGGNGCGINNKLTDTHFFVLKNNCLYNNIGSDFIGVQASPSDIIADPQYADRSKHDYHLKSKAGRWNGTGWVNDSISSPCIDAGDPLSSYSNEPEPNGNRINIGPDGDTCYASKSELNLLTPAFPIANFSSNVTSGCAPLSIQFIDTSQNATAWDWDFGDSVYSTQQNPIHIYSVPGNYLVKLVASNKNGTNLTISTINVSERSILPVANFSVSAASGFAPLSVHFTDLSQNVAGWNWNFGDGAISTQQNPNHNYSSARNYTVNLTATNANGTSSKLATIIVQKETPDITWSKPANITYGIALSSLQLNAQTSVPGIFVYTPKAGTILSEGTQTLYVDFSPNDTANYTTTSKSTTITVLRPVPPISSFSSNVTTGIVPLSVFFTDTCTNSPTSWNWNFGDGTPNSTQKNPTHIYSKAGSYTVILTANNAAGSNTVKKTNYITASPLKLPVANLSANVTSGTLPLTILFSDKSSGGFPSSWSWNFGDGTYSIERNPVHIYNKTGKYNVKLTVKNAAGSNTLTKSNYVTVNAFKPPTAAFSASTISGKAPLTVTFTDKSTGSPTSWAWNFGEKGTSTVKNPVYKYNKAGIYTVTLTAKNTAGSNTAKMTNYITLK